MAAHPMICSPDYLKQIPLKKKFELVKRVNCEMDEYIKQMANDIDEAPVYGKVHTMIKNGAKFEEIVEYLTKNYYFAKMPKEYLMLYQTKTLIHTIELYNRLKPISAFKIMDTSAASAEADEAASASAENELFDFMVSSTSSDGDENNDIDDFIEALLKK